MRCAKATHIMDEKDYIIKPHRRHLATALKYLGGLLFAFVLAGSCALIPVCCTSEERAGETLQKAGYTKIETRGYGWFACDGNDRFSTLFSAVNPLGKRVEGVVCCGFFKACTIRF